MIKKKVLSKTECALNGTLQAQHPLICIYHSLL